MFELKFLILSILILNHLDLSNGQETTDLKENAREIVAKISILETKLTTTPVSKEMMKQLDFLFTELNEVLGKFEGEDKELYTRIVAKLREKFDTIKKQFQGYYDVYLIDDEIEKKMLELENILANLPQRNLYPIFSKLNESLECVQDMELKLNDDLFHHKLDRAFFQIRRALHQLRKLDFLEKQIDSLDSSINKLFTLYREMYFGEKSKLKNMGKLIEQANVQVAQ